MAFGTSIPLCLKLYCMIFSNMWPKTFSFWASISNTSVIWYQNCPRSPLNGLTKRCKIPGVSKDVREQSHWTVISIGKDLHSCGPTMIYYKSKINMLRETMWLYTSAHFLIFVPSQSQIWFSRADVEICKRLRKWGDW